MKPDYVIGDLSTLIWISFLVANGIENETLCALFVVRGMFFDTLLPGSVICIYTNNAGSSRYGKMKEKPCVLKKRCLAQLSHKRSTYAYFCLKTMAL